MHTVFHYLRARRGEARNGVSAMQSYLIMKACVLVWYRHSTILYEVLGCNLFEPKHVEMCL